MQTISLGELEFEFISSGSKGDPLVLFLHGFPQTNHAWRHQLPFIADHGYYCVAPNQRGYSRGARPTGVDQYATSLLVQDMLSLVDAFGYNEADIVGHDWGGQISWLLAAFHPDKVRSLTVLSRPHPAAFTWAMQQDKKQADRSKHHKAFQNRDTATLLLEDGARRLRKSFTSQGVPESDVDAYLKVLGEFDALDAAVNWYRTRTDGTALLGDNVPAVEVPTLYLWGAADASVGKMAVTKTAEYVTAEYKLIEIPQVGHFITDQVIDVVNSSLLDHLNRVMR